MNTILESNKVTIYLCLYKMKQEKKGTRIITRQTSSSDNESIKLVVYILEISFLKPQNYVFYNKMWHTIYVKLPLFGNYGLYIIISQQIDRCCNFDRSIMQHHRKGQLLKKMSLFLFARYIRIKLNVICLRIQFYIKYSDFF